VMRLRYLAGDRPGALLAFDRCEQALKHEVERLVPQHLPAQAAVTSA